MDVKVGKVDIIGEVDPIDEDSTDAKEDDVDRDNSVGRSVDSVDKIVCTDDKEDDETDVSVDGDSADVDSNRIDEKEVGNEEENIVEISVDGEDEELEDEKMDDDGNENKGCCVDGKVRYDVVNDSVRNDDDDG